MGLSFEEILGSLGRWIDRTSTEISWRWRSRSFSGGSGPLGRLGDSFERFAAWGGDLFRQLGWWLQVRGINTQRFAPGGPMTAKKASRWVVFAVFAIICFFVVPRTWQPPDAAPLTEQEVAALQVLRVPSPSFRGPGGPPTPPAPRNSALKDWLLSALGLR